MILSNTERIIKSGDVLEGQGDYSWGYSIFYFNEETNKWESHDIRGFSVDDTGLKTSNGMFYNEDAEYLITSQSHYEHFIKRKKYIGNIFENNQLLEELNQ